MKKIIIMLCAVLFVLISAVFFERSYSAVQPAKGQAPLVNSIQQDIVADAGQTPCKTADDPCKAPCKTEDDPCKTPCKAKDDPCKSKTWMGKMTDNVKDQTKKIGNGIKKPFTTVGEKVRGVKNKTP